MGVFLSGKDVFAALPTGYSKSLCYTCLPYAFDIASFQGPRPASRRLQYGKRREAGRGPGNEATFDNREAKKDGFLASQLASLKADQKARFFPRGMSAQFIDEAQCNPRVVESVREGKAQLESFCQCALCRG